MQRSAKCERTFLDFFSTLKIQIRIIVKFFIEKMSSSVLVKKDFE